jgi:uncharacterized membrane protein
MVKLEDSENYKPTQRFETLVDGIFAIAMTLLVLGLAVPNINGSLSNMVVQNAFSTLLPSFFVLVLSFFLLFVFWNAHHRLFNQMEIIDTNLLWINAVWLLFIILVPFSASALGHYGGYILPSVIFNLNMLGIGILNDQNKRYAIRKKFVQTVTSDLKIHLYVNNVFILLSLLAIILSFIITGWSTILYTLLLPMNFVFRRLNWGT